MGVVDKARDVTDKAKDVTEENVDKLGGVVEKAADKVDEKTGGKYSDRINQVVDAIQDPANSAAAVEEPPSPPEP